MQYPGLPGADGEIEVGGRGGRRSQGLRAAEERHDAGAEPNRRGIAHRVFPA